MDSPLGLSRTNGALVDQYGMIHAGAKAHRNATALTSSAGQAKIKVVQESKQSESEAQRFSSE